ncbi:MAG TPA: hypothetical protein VKC34_12240 [Blastocatellia bacterium]|nr:hypothetical protein [Blastocatellia bacterium]
MRVAQFPGQNDGLGALKRSIERSIFVSAEHLTYTQLEQYVDDRLESRGLEVVEGHLNICESCSSEANDLIEFKTTLAARARNVVPDRRLRVWERVIASWKTPGLRLAGAAAAFVIVLALVIIPLQRRIAAPMRQVNEAQANKDAPEEGRSPNTDLKSAVESGRQPEQPPRGEKADDPVSGARLSLTDGARVVGVDRHGSVRGLDGLSPSEEQMVSRALLTGHVEPPSSVSEVARIKGTMMGRQGEGNPFSLMAPLGTGVERDRPKFRWRALSGASGYRVSIYDTDFNKVTSSPVVTGTQWVLPHPLERGAVYIWQVTATKDNKEITSPVPPAPEARFKVIEQATLPELKRVRERHADSHLIKGLFYVRFGLLDEAEREFKLLLASNPGSPAAKRLFRNVRRLRSPG